MRLRTQTLLFGLLTLAVPVIAWQSVRQLHLSLQQTRIDAQTLRVANMRVSLAETGVVATELSIGHRAATATDWYAETAPLPLFVDGYADDWQELTGTPLSYRDGVNTPVSLKLRVAQRVGRLYLFARVQDRSVVHHVPPTLDPEPGENEQLDAQALLANGDAIELFLQPPDQAPVHALFSNIAPGPVETVIAADSATARAGARIPGWHAEWVDNATGYQVEIELPLPAVGTRIGVAVIDVTQPVADAALGDARGDAWVGTMSPAGMRTFETTAPLHAAPHVSMTGGMLYHESPTARARLDHWVTPGTRARLFDAEGRLLADVNDLYSPMPDADGDSGWQLTGLLDAMLLRVFALFAAGDLPLFPETVKSRQPLHLPSERRTALDLDQPTQRYVTVDNDRVLGTLVPLGERVAADPSRSDGGAAHAPLGYLLYESNEEHAAALTGSRLARLFALLLLASFAIGSLLFSWSTLLSLRIRRLSHEASLAVDRDGRVATLVGSGARDEIGDLSRNLSALLARSAAYTRYLEGLSRRLSHELGTPLSVVRTSIENLDRQRLDDETRTLVDRASGGADRLGAIIRALVESTRLEQSVQHADFQAIDLSGWAREAAEQYAQVYPDHHFRVVSALEQLLDSRHASMPTADAATPRGNDDRIPVYARVASGLLQQALDKLIDNACDFATDPDIAIVVLPGKSVTLAVANVGRSPGSERLATLFSTEPGAQMSVREGEQARDNAHAGLGLYIVRMIADAHDGTPIAHEIGPWIVVGLSLPTHV